jgi:hypothetical protein
MSIVSICLQSSNSFPNADIYLYTFSCRVNNNYDFIHLALDCKHFSMFLKLLFYVSKRLHTSLLLMKTCF